MNTLASLERDLRFFPVSEQRPLRVLNPEQIRNFNREGILAPLDVFSGADVLRNVATFEHLLAQYQARGHDSYSVNSCQSTCGSLYDLVTHPRIVDLVCDILGDQVACWGTHYFCKLPHDPKQVSWHQDAPYWPFSPSKTVTVWLAIDDVDEGNAAMRVIPGSHRAGALPIRQSDPSENNVLWLTTDGAEQMGTPRSVNLRAGQISLHSDLLLHGSLANDSSRRRCGLTMRYCSVDVRAGDGWNQRSILVRGNDPSGHWGTVTERPSGEDPFTDGRVIGAN
jgi:non-haem Fe2+, alpha-ketoglutarate-dependent halogenase